MEVRSSQSLEFEGVLDLAHRLFPPAVLEPDDQLRAEVDGHSRVPYRFLAWQEEHIEGFVRFARLDMNVGFIVHIGVAPERQGSGLGMRLLTAARNVIGLDVLLAEVEDGPALDWWQRQGADVVSATYTQPPLRPNTEPAPLNLVALGPWRTVPRLIEGFYEEVWGLNEDAPLVRRAVAA